MDFWVFVRSLKELCPVGFWGWIFRWVWFPGWQLFGCYFSASSLWCLVFYSSCDAVLIPVATVPTSTSRWAGVGFNAKADEEKQGNYVFPSQMHATDQRDWSCLIPPQKLIYRQCTECIRLSNRIKLYKPPRSFLVWSSKMSFLRKWITRQISWSNRCGRGGGINHHDGGRDSLVYSQSPCSIACLQEKSLVPNSNSRPGDVYLQSRLTWMPAACSVTIVSSQQKKLSIAGGNVVSFLTFAEDTNNIHYENCRTQGIRLIPFASETLVGIPYILPDFKTSSIFGRWT